MAGTELNDEAVRFVTRYLGVMPAGAERAGQGQTGIVALQKARLDYVSVRKATLADLTALESAIGAVFKDQPDHAEMTRAAKEVHKVLELVDESLIDTLDDALNAEDPGLRSVHQRKAAGIVAQYRKFVDSHPLLAILDGNPIRPVKVQARLRETLSALQAQLA